MSESEVELTHPDPLLTTEDTESTEENPIAKIFLCVLSVLYGENL